MSDASPPNEPPSSELGGETGGTGKPGLVQRFRELPVWAQVLIPAVVGGVLVGAALLIANATSSKQSSTATATSIELTTTTTPNHAFVHGAAVLLVVKQLAAENATPPTEPATTELPTSTTAAPTTESSTPATQPSTTHPSTTEPSTSTTAAPTSESSTPATQPSTTQPSTTEPSTSTSEPSTTEPATGVLPAGTLAASPAAFATAWNHSVEGTDVPPLSQGPTPPPNWTQEPVGGVAAYRANLGDNVWLVALAQSPGAAIAQALLIWEPNVDSAHQPAQNALYRDAFQALTKTVNSSITAAQRLKVTAQLGLTRRHPPFPDTTQRSAVQPPHEYDLFNVDPAHPTQPGPATVISVINSQG
jgi:hypothetical protein